MYMGLQTVFVGLVRATKESIMENSVGRGTC